MTRKHLKQVFYNHAISRDQLFVVTRYRVMSGYSFLIHFQSGASKLLAPKTGIKGTGQGSGGEGRGSRGRAGGADVRRPGGGRERGDEAYDSGDQATAGRL